MIHLTMGVLLNNFVLVKQILAMLAVVVMIMSKVKTVWVLSLRFRTLGLYVIILLFRFQKYLYRWTDLE